MTKPLRPAAENGKADSLPVLRFTAKAETVTAACPPMPLYFIDNPFDIKENRPGSKPGPDHCYKRLCASVLSVECLNTSASLCSLLLTCIERMAL